MAEKCQRIASSLQVPPSYALDEFFKNLAWLKGDFWALETCDLDYFKKDLYVSFSNDDFISRFGSGDSFKYGEAMEFLYDHLKNAPYDRYQHFLEKHLSKEGRERIRERLKNQTEKHIEEKEVQQATPEEIEKWRKQIALFEKFLKEPQIQKLLLDRQLEFYQNQMAAARKHEGEKNWNRLKQNIQWFKAALPSLYQYVAWEAEYKINYWTWVNINYWQWFDWIWNKGFRNIYALGAGLAAGAVAIPMVPIAMIAAGVADSVGEEGTKVVIKPDYTAGQATANLAWRAPFATLKGLAFARFGFWVAGSVFVGTTFLEAVGRKPYEDDRSLKNRFIDGAISSGVAAASLLGLKAVSKWLAPALLNRLVKAKPPALQPTPAPTATSPQSQIVITESEVRPITDRIVRPQATGPKKFPPRDPEKREPVKRGPWESPRQRADTEKPVTPPRGMPPSTPRQMRYVVRETALAQRSFAEIGSKPVQDKLKAFVETLARKLRDGISPTAITNIRKETLRSRDDVWVSQMIGRAKPKVYFAIRGANGDRQIVVLAYSYGEKQQQQILRQLERMENGD